MLCFSLRLSGSSNCCTPQGRTTSAKACSLPCYCAESSLVNGFIMALCFHCDLPAHFSEFWCFIVQRKVWLETVISLLICLNLLSLPQIFHLWIPMKNPCCPGWDCPEQPEISTFPHSFVPSLFCLLTESEVHFYFPKQPQPRFNNSALIMMILPYLMLLICALRLQQRHSTAIYHHPPTQPVTSGSPRVMHSGGYYQLLAKLFMHVVWETYDTLSSWRVQNDGSWPCEMLTETKQAIQCFWV